ncbi:PREDICTED: zinc finger protein ZAT9-like [Nelumbo nucifera]|uniref:Zinc finger protein ZAT9-like n=1 Tax=Nelumbo nucifera TaxID=4432 RepID=A0A1U8A2D1_NELNU|nr:PREDICTED: zinc finger protein ZAT9-like [Nelumbo nucifera]
MAMTVDQQPGFKHFCRVCKKGFGCGRALGGHMRAHGIGDEAGQMEDEDQASDWEDKLGGNTPPGNKRMYALRTNPNRLKSCRICENCGKEFSSWKSFLEHGKCSSEDVESLVSSPLPGSDDEDGAGRRGCGWSKRRRSMRTKVGNSNSNCPSSEEEDLANCLVMLSTARVDPLVAETEESCASASKEEERRNPVGVVVPVPSANRISASNIVEKAKGVARGMFECKACKKVFNSHQALGGHRASHKKVKGCFAARLDDHDESLVEEDVITHDEFLIPTKSNAILPFEQASQPPLAIPAKRKSKVHECSICHRVFSSGQALGGHKRCHWVTSNSPDTSSIAKFHQFQDQTQQLHQRPKFNKSEPLDLNLPAPVDDIAGVRQDPENPLSFDVPTAIFLQPWIGIDTNTNSDHHHHHPPHAHLNNEDNNEDNNNNTTTTTNANTSVLNVDDEADSKVKLAKLSELKDMSMGGGSSPWLQVGIGSTGNGGGGDP